MSQRTFVPNHIRSAYEGLLQAFQTAVEDADRSVRLASLPIHASFFSNGAVVEFKRSMYLRNWPHRRLSGEKRLDVLICARETFTTKPWELTKSTVYANYFVAVGESAPHLVQGLHYDFVAEGQDAHPIFHVQLSDEVISEEFISDLRNEGFDAELKGCENPSHSWVTTRIPTSEMTLASVLYCLVADHLKPGIFLEFARKVKAIVSKLPVLSFEALKESLSDSKDFKSPHWFAHMTDLEE